MRRPRYNGLSAQEYYKPLPADLQAKKEAQHQEALAFPKGSRVVVCTEPEEVSTVAGYYQTRYNGTQVKIRRDDGSEYRCYADQLKLYTEP